MDLYTLCKWNEQHVTADLEQQDLKNYSSLVLCTHTPMLIITQIELYENLKFNLKKKFDKIV